MKKVPISKGFLKMILWHLFKSCGKTMSIDFEMTWKMFPNEIVCVGRLNNTVIWKPSFWMRKMMRLKRTTSSRSKETLDQVYWSSSNVERLDEKKVKQNVVEKSCSMTNICLRYNAFRWILVGLSEIKKKILDDLKRLKKACQSQKVLQQRDGRQELLRGLHLKFVITNKRYSM